MCASQRPILVTGAHRTGTTWVGKMLALDRNVGYIHEPFNLSTSRGVFDYPTPYWYTHIDDLTSGASDAWQAYRDLLEFRYRLGAALRDAASLADIKNVVRDAWQFHRNRSARLRPLIKDPLALLSAPWIADRFEPQILVLIRHPAAFAGSLKVKDWTFPFDHLLQQSRLMDGPLEPHQDRIARLADAPPDIVDQAAHLWAILYGVVDACRSEQPSWTFLRHEDLCRHPIEEFRKLYDRVGLIWTEYIETEIERATRGNDDAGPRTGSQIQLDSRAVLWNWQQRLTDKEIARVRKITAPVATAFYRDEDWQPPTTD